MNCWEILGIDPTDNRAVIDEAYERQRKFAAEDELDTLRAAYQEATGAKAPNHQTQAPEPTQAEDQSSLSAEEHQVVREVVIQIKALLNDSRRAKDEGIWKAILCEPPADVPRVREQIANELEPQIRPLAANGSFPASVSHFLSDWFGWQELAQGPEESRFDDVFNDPQRANPSASEESHQPSDQTPPTVDFWPAVIGWIIALAVLGMIFDGLLGGG